MITLKKTLIFFLVLLFVFYLVYEPHIGYTFPFHVDEWHHISRARYLINTGDIPSLDEYTSRRVSHIEQGFHLFLAELFLMTDIDPVLQFKFLPALFACISATIVFVSVYRATNQFYTGIFAMIFLASMRTNVNILGLVFFIPLTLGFSLMYLFFLFFPKGLGSWKHFGVSIVILLTSFLIHPPTGLFIYTLLPFCSILWAKKIKKIIQPVALLALIFLILFNIYYYAYGHRFALYEMFSHPPDILVDYLNRSFVWYKGSYPLEIEYNLFTLYGSLSSILALIGVYPAIKNKAMRFFVVWSFIASLMCYSYNLAGFTILIQYQKLLHYAMLGMVPLSALGLNFVLRRISFFLKQVIPGIKYKKFLISLLMILLVITTFTKIFGGYYEPKIYDTYSGTKEIPLYYPAITMDEYYAIKWIEEVYGYKNIILAPLWASEAIPAITDNEVIASMYFRGNNTSRGDVGKFFESNCKFQREKIEAYGTDIVLSKIPLNCTNFEEVYSKNSVYVYKF